MNTIANREQAILMAINGLEQIKKGVSILHKAYDAYPELNNMQPDATSQCIPMSIDEWEIALDILITEWNDIT